MPNKTQVENFIKASKELEADESEVAFDQVLRKVAKAPPAPVHKPTKKRPKNKRRS